MVEFGPVRMDMKVGSARDFAVFATMSRQRWATALLMFSAILVCVAFAAYLARSTIAGAPGVVLGVIAATPWLMLAAPVGLAGAIATRNWYLVAVAGVVTILCVATQFPLFVAADPPSNAATVNVMTFNLKLGQADPNSVVAAAHKHNVDVLMLEELTPDAQRGLSTAGIDSEFPYHASMAGRGAWGTGLWSRYPLSNIDYPRGFGFVLVTAQVQIPGLATTPSVVALHMAGPIPQSARWKADMALLPGVLQALPESAPVIVGGDFNATYDSKAFRKLLRGGYHDGADQAGAGIVRTFPANRWFPPLIGIDHVLTRGAAAVHLRTVEIPGSDHRAVVAALAVPRGS
jgi:endonuclease/exonuclease/phosphatase (EEP) superfamily protein YafD